MRRTGFGADLDYDDVPEGRLVHDADGTRAAAFWIARERSDLHDDDTIYEIAVWDVATRRRLESHTRIHSLGVGGERGRAITAVRFDAAGALEIVYDDGSAEPAERAAEPEPPWSRRDPDSPPPRLFDPPRDT